MKLIPLSNGDFAKVDDADFEWLSQRKWYLHPKGYAAEMSRGKFSWMHRLINNTPAGIQTDHINGDKLDNRRENLRSCTITENNRNRPTPTKNTSGFKGVSWDKRKKNWKVDIRINNKTKYIGNFASKEDAAKAYDTAAKQYHGDFAKTNLPA